VRSLSATSVVAAGLAGSATAGLLRAAFPLVICACVLVVLVIHMNMSLGIHVRMILPFPAGEGGDGVRVHDATRIGHFIFPLGKYLRRRKDSSLRLRLDEVNLQERLEVQVRHLILVRHTQQLRKSRVREDATLERRVEAAVLLHVVRDELRDLRLGTLLARLQAHEVAQLVRQGTLDEEGVVGTAGLPCLTLLRGHVLRVLLLLLLDLTGLTLRRLDGVRNTLRGLADTGRQLRRQGLELLRQAGEDDIGALRRLDDGRGRRRLNRRHGDNRLRGDGRLGGLGSLRRLGRLGGLGNRGRGRGDGGRLLRRHL